MIWISVAQKHQTSLNNAKNLNESEARLKSIRLQKSNDEAERNFKAEVERLRSAFEKSAKEKEEQFRTTIKEYQERDIAWQEEKQVRNLYHCLKLAELTLLFQ